MKTKVPSTHKPKSFIPHCPYEIPISTIYNPNCADSEIPVVSIYNPNLNQNTRPPEGKPNMAEAKPSFKRLCLEKLKAQFQKDHRPKLEFYAALCFLISLVVTGAIIVILHKNTTKDVLLVHGEFTILNVEYSTAFSHRNSSYFKHISKEICHAVGNTFLVPGLIDFYRHCRVTTISPNMNCHVLVTFANDPAVTIGQIGLTFIRGLRILHGKAWLGSHVVNVQSIGFMISGQEGQWGEWSEWSDCNVTLGVSTRTRPCLNRQGERLESVDRCLLIPGAKSDLDIRKCETSVGADASRDAELDRDSGDSSSEAISKSNEDVVGVNNSKDDKETVNESKDVKERVNGSKDVKEKVNGSKDVKEKVNGSKDVKERVNGSKDVKEKVNGSKDVKERVNDSEDVKERVNDSKDFKERVNDSKDDKERVNESKDFKERVNDSKDGKEGVNDSKELVNHAQEEDKASSEVEVAEVKEVDVDGKMPPESEDMRGEAKVRKERTN